MIHVPIHEGEAKGEGSYSWIIPMLPWYKYFIPVLQYVSRNGFQEMKQKIAQGR